MTLSEFDREFDILYNNISSNLAPGLDRYEKSVFLTKAQENVVIKLYSGRNATLSSFEVTEENRRYLDYLIKEKTIPYTDTSTTSYSFKLPDDVLFITYETATLNTTDSCLKDKEIDVIPVTQDAYQNIRNNPFRGSNTRRILRLDKGAEWSTEDKYIPSIELIPPKGYSLASYKFKYLQKPTPIILEGVSESINNITATQTEGQYVGIECKLNPILHRMILDEAVALAISAMASTIQK